MKTFSFKRTNAPFVVVVHDNPKEMVIDHLNEFQRHLLQAADMGTNLEEFDMRFERLDQMLSHSKIVEARKERENMRYGVYFFLQRLNIQSRALADLVVSINGQEFERNDESLERAAKLLSSHLTLEEQEEIVDHIKGKFGGR